MVPPPVAILRLHAWLDAHPGVTRRVAAVGTRTHRTLVVAPAPPPAADGGGRGGGADGINGGDSSSGTPSPRPPPPHVLLEIPEALLLTAATAAASPPVVAAMALAAADPSLAADPIPGADGEHMALVLFLTAWQVAVGRAAGAGVAAVGGGGARGGGGGGGTPGGVGPPFDAWATYLNSLPPPDGLPALCRLPAAAVAAALGGTPAGAAAAAVATELEEVLTRLVAPLATASSTAAWYGVPPSSGAGGGGGGGGVPPKPVDAASAAAAAATALRDAFLYAQAVVDSRAFRLPLRGGPGLVLVPLADMGDHVPTGGGGRGGDIGGPLVAAKLIDPSTGAFQLALPPQSAIGGGASDGVCPPPGTAVGLDYGRLDNLSLLLFYGFCVAVNPADGVELALDAPAATATDDAATAAAKEILLGTVAGLGEEHTLTLQPPLSQPLAGDAPTDAAAAAPPLPPSYLPPGLLPSLRLLRARPPALAGMTVTNAAAVLAAPSPDAASEAATLGVLDAQLRTLEAALPPPPSPPPPRPPSSPTASFPSQPLSSAAPNGDGADGDDSGSGWLPAAAELYVAGLRRVLGGARTELRGLAAAAEARAAARGCGG